ncbi:hypothetical protein HPB50_014962 [Hyalomma asiaticum]|uniref:Uncharacterized protein n=1 Tax=Hyalomma asiaticum TaxID=266040 RepID=A0ACB7S5A1_HYAAI|nr:hypothetical protein HPB50_014962 [Hyalomma asiaticum]
MSPASAPSTTVSRRQMLAKPVNTIRQGSQEYPVSAACALFTCCSLAVVGALMLGLYLFSQSKDGQVMATKVMRFLRIVAKNTKASSTVTAASVGVRVKVDVLSHVTDRSSVDIKTTSAHPTVKTVPPCRRLLCAYQTSRWIFSSTEHPCDDFYSFVCGNWSQAGQNDTSSFGTDQHKETEVLLHTLLEERRAAVPKDDPVVSLYDTCLERTSYADSKLFVSSLLQRLGLSKWPYKDNVMSKNEMWNIHARIFRTLGISPLVTVSHVPDPRNVSRTVISLEIPPLYAKTDGDVRLPTWYLPSLYRATSMFDSDFYEDVSQRVLQFVGKLAQLRAKFKERPRFTTLSSEPFYSVLVRYTMEGLVAVKSDAQLQLYNRAFFKALKSLISRTKSSSVYNYLGFCVLVHVSPLLSNEFETMSQAQMAWMSQRWQSSWTLWQRCLWFIDDMDPTLLLSVFSKYAKTHMRLVNVSSVTQRLRRVFRARTPGLQWCAGERAKSCLSFIDGMSIKVVDFNATRTTLPKAGNMTTGFFLEEYVAFKRRKVETSLAQPTAGWRSVFSLFTTTPDFDAKTRTLYLPLVPFFDLFHNTDLDLLVKAAIATSSLNRTAFVSVEELVHDVTAWELAFRHFSGIKWDGYVFPGNHSTEKSFFIFAVMGKCHNAIPVAPSAQLALRSVNEEMQAINEAFANTRVFGNLWGCNNHTIMNPEAKCNLWKS